MVGAQIGTHVEVCLNKQLEFLPVPYQYVYSLMSFTVNSQEIFQTNSSIHNINTRNKHHLHQPNAHQPLFQTSTFYAGTKIFKILLPSVTILKNYKAKCFLKSAVLRKYLRTQSVYSIDDFLCVKTIHNIFVKCLQNFTL